jgi:hypothetical protein
MECEVVVAKRRNTLTEGGHHPTPGCDRESNGSTFYRSFSYFTTLSKNIEVYRLIPQLLGE